MQIKEFLEQKNYSHLLADLEANFEIKPKPTWSILDAINKRYGVGWYFVVGKSLKRVWNNGTPEGSYCWLFVMDTFGKKILFPTQVDGCDISSYVVMHSFINELKKHLLISDPQPPSDREKVYTMIKEAFGAN